jgi:hypothetical protein
VVVGDGERNRVLAVVLLAGLAAILTGYANRMFGWENADMARLHTRKVAQKKLAASGAAKLSLGEIAVPPAVSPIRNIKQNNNLKSGWCPRTDSNQHALAGNRF